MSEALKNITRNLAGFLDGIFHPSRTVVLAYHSVGDGVAPLSVRSEKFREQMNFLQTNGVRVISMEEFAAAVQDKIKLRGKNVLLTFDDGYADIMTNALPILHEFGFSATVFVNPALVGAEAGFASEEGDKKRPLLALSDIRKLEDRGIDFANHGFSHRPFGGLTETEIAGEYEKAKEWLYVNLPHSKSDVFAYPKGDIGRGVEVLRKCRARLAFAGGEMPVGKVKEPLAIPRVTVHSSWNIGEFSSSLNPFYLFARKYKNFLLPLVALVILKIILSVILLSGWPAVGVGPYFFTQGGGDDTSYVRAAQSIVSGNFNFTPMLGFPLVLAVFMLLTGFTALPQIAFPAVLFNLFIVGPVSLALAMAIVHRIWRRPLYTLLSGFSVIALPYVWHFILGGFSVLTNLGTTDLIGLSRSQQLFGLPILSDHLSALLIYAGLFFAVSSYLGGKARYGLSGFFFGLSVMARAQNVILGLAIGFVLLLCRRFKNAVSFALFAFLGMLPQLAQNFFLTGLPWLFADYSPKYNSGLSDSTFGLHNILSLPARLYHYSPLALAALILVSILFSVASLYYFRKNRFLFATVLLGGLLSPLALFMFDSTARNPRYFLPFIPIFLMMVFATGEALVRKTYRA